MYNLSKLQVLSYGGTLAYVQRYTTNSPDSEPTSDHDIIISGNGRSIFYSFDEPLKPEIRRVTLIDFFLDFTLLNLRHAKCSLQPCNDTYKMWCMGVAYACTVVCFECIEHFQHSMFKLFSQEALVPIVEGKWRVLDQRSGNPIASRRDILKVRLFDDLKNFHDLKHFQETPPFSTPSVNLPNLLSNFRYCRALITF